MTTRDPGVDVDDEEAMGRVRQLVADAPTMNGGATGSPVAGPRATWTVRHTLVTLVLTPLLLIAFHSAAGSPAGALGAVLLLAAAMMAALTYATYLPGSSRIGGSPCAATAWALPIVALLAVAATGTPVFAVVITGAGLFQRLTGTATCPR